MPPLTAPRYTDAELREIAKVTPEDIAGAVILWQRFAPRVYREIINAPSMGLLEVIGAQERPASARFLWDVRKLQYFDRRSGQYMDPLKLRNDAIEPFLKKVKDSMRGMSTRLQRREVSLSEWQASQMQTIKESQIAAALVANGGTQNNTPIDYIKIAAFVLALFLFLRTFVDEIKSGVQKLTGLLLGRTGLYASAGVDAYEEMRRHAAGMYTELAEERRVMNPGANHCKTVGDHIGCPELAAMGWQPLGVLPRLYDTPCGSNCQCHWEFR